MTNKGSERFLFMSKRLQCEFSLIRYVPDPVKGEFVNIGVLLRGADAASAPVVRFTRDWRRVRCMDADADVEMLESLEAEMNARLRVAEREDTKPMMQVLEDTLANSLQMTEARGVLADSYVAELDSLMRLHVEPLKIAGARKKQGGRAAIVAAMRNEFERAGVWGLMRKRIPAAQYTRAGDPLKVDCGYRNGKVRMFHAVSLESDAEAAKGLAYSAAGLREGVARAEGVELELTAVVEPASSVNDAELYGFGVSVMESAALRVVTVAELARLAEVARLELRV